MSTTRRNVLEVGVRSVAALGVAGLFKSVASARGLDQIVVSINLIGGNDSNNMVVPLDDPQYGFYMQGRGELAIAKSSLLPITSARHQATYGLHPNLAELQDLYQRGALGVVANVGSLSSPLSRTQVLGNQGSLPADLSLHTSDSRWNFMRPGFGAPSWTADFQKSIFNKDPMETFGFSSGLHVVPAERTGIEGAQMDNAKILQAMRASTPLRTIFPSTGLGLQLRQVAQLIQASAKLGIARPVFAATLSGFDTHRNQLAAQTALFTELSQAMSAFYEATREIGMSDRVTTYTDTEFNRALAPNTTHGSEHGWGGHQLVMGDGMSGGDVFGDFPSLELGGANDAGSNGVWIPNLANHQFHSAIAQRYGLRSSEIARLMPDLQHFSASPMQI